MYYKIIHFIQYIYGLLFNIETYKLKLLSRDKVINEFTKTITEKYENNEEINLILKKLNDDFDIIDNLLNQFDKDTIENDTVNIYNIISVLKDFLNKHSFTLTIQFDINDLIVMGKVIEFLQEYLNSLKLENDVTQIDDKQITDYTMVNSTKNKLITIKKILEKNQEIKDYMDNKIIF